MTVTDAQPFTDAQLDHIRSVLRELILHSRVESVIKSIQPPSYQPRPGEVYAFRYRDHDGWSYGRWYTGKVEDMKFPIEQRALTVTERAVP